ncbi:DUF305 domain-containing protein [Bordetella sputigena]|uniref:DUF305 domain-containing protein n=1 Tax=Bordetella sputigena TaxID=1416810 RepID=UPI0039EF5322
MTLRFARIRRGAVLALAASLALGGAAWAAGTAGGDEAAFLAENNAAMDRMMAGMEAKPSGDVDQDFVAMMIPHHQGAIEMAQAELRYGRNEQLRRIAQEIIVDQQQEIAAMRLALGQPLPPSTPAPTQPDLPAGAPSSTTTPMSMSHHPHMMSSGVPEQ